MRVIGIDLMIMFLTMSGPSNVAPETRLPEFQNGNGLLELCASDSGQSQSICLGYIQGVVDGAGITPVEKTCRRTSSYWCIPDGVAWGQMTEVVVKYMKDHPENRHWPSTAIITNAVIESWPCHK